MCSVALMTFVCEELMTLKVPEFSTETYADTAEIAICGHPNATRLSWTSAWYQTILCMFPPAGLLQTQSPLQTQKKEILTEQSLWWPSMLLTLPKAAFIDSFAGSPAYTPEQNGSMSLSKASLPRFRLTNCSTVSSKPGEGNTSNLGSYS